MDLTPDDKIQIEANFDKCDAALLDKPILSSIYDENWRRALREQALSARKHGEVTYGAMGYAAPFYEEIGQCPKCYQSRLEEGADILLPRLSSGDREHLEKRMRGDNPTSGEEEILLARGFAFVFGVNAIRGPNGNPSFPRPEFWVSVEGQSIAVEAKGLLDSKSVRDLNRCSICSVQGYWISGDPSIGAPNHVRSALAKKILKSSVHSPCVIVLTLYGAFDFLTGIDLARQLAVKPSDFNIPKGKYPLALALILDRFVCGVWFNSCAAERARISNEIKERVRTAVKNSFWPRPDGVFLHEKMSSCEHNKVVDMIRSKVK